MQFKQFLSVFSAAAMLLGISAQGARAEARLISKSFDSNTAGILNVDADGNTTAYKETVDQVYFDVEADHSVGFTEAPKAASKFSTLTEPGDTDMAFMLKVNDQSAATANAPWAQISTLPSDLYEKGKIRISCNLYIAKSAGDSHAPIQISLRTKGNKESALLAYRTTKKMQFNANSNYETTSTYSYGAWHNVLFEIDTVNKTYIPYINGETPALKTAGAIPMTNADNVSFNSADGDRLINGIRITVNGKGKSKGTEIYFDDLSVEELATTDKLVVDDFNFYSQDKRVKEISSGEAVSARAVVTYSEKTAKTPVSMYAALYGADLQLKGVCRQDEVIPETSEKGEFQKSVSMPVSFAQPYESGDSVMLYLWDEAIKPLAEPVGLNVRQESYFFDQSFTSRSSQGIAAYNLGTESDPYMIPSVTNEIGGGYAYKMDCPFIPDGGTPYITISPKTITKDTVNIAMKIRQNLAHPKLLELEGAGGRSELVNFRPTGEIQINGKKVGTYTDSVWTDYRFEVDTVNKTYIVYQNETQIAEGSYTADFTSLRFTVQYNKNNVNGKSLIYLDDIKIY